jgi:thiamine biosynthesis lipoprotein
MATQRHRRQEAPATDEAPEPELLPSSSGPGRRAPAPSDQISGTDCHRRHGRDRRGGGQGAPGGGIGAEHEWDRVNNDADHGADHITNLRVIREQRRHVDDARHEPAHYDHDPPRRHFRGDVAPVTTTMRAPSTAMTARRFRAIGTEATVVVLDPILADRAEAMLRREIDAIDRACSRFRPDSELAQLQRNAGRPVVVSPLLFEALEVALTVAERTHGAVDPTIGNAIAALGYDRDFDQIESQPSIPTAELGPIVGFGHVHCDARTRSVRIPRGVQLDLGSSAKAFVVDRAAARIADQLDTAVLVSVGGDVRVAGPPPPGGWPIGIAVDSSIPEREVEHVVAIDHGGLASSSTAVRTWSVGTTAVHHIIDPSTGYCAEPYWTLVSVAGASCVEANALSTAAVVWGRHAVELLRPFGQAVRLVRNDGVVVTLGGWPGGDAP